MRTLTLCLGIGIVLTAACGGGSSGHAGGATAAGGAPATGGALIATGTGGVGGFSAQVSSGGAASSAVAGALGTGGATSTTHNGGTSSTGIGGSLPVAGSFAGTGGTGAGGTGGSSSLPTGNCAALPCMTPLVNLLSGCQATGSCISQTITSGTSMAVFECYSNGVTISIAVDESSLSAPITALVTKGGSACYAMVISDYSGASPTIAINNIAGVTVAILGSDASGNDTVTCPGGTPTVVDSTCQGTVNAAAGVTATCTAGVCHVTSGPDSGVSSTDAGTRADGSSGTGSVWVCTSSSVTCTTTGDTVQACCNAENTQCKYVVGSIDILCNGTDCDAATPTVLSYCGII